MRKYKWYIAFIGIVTVLASCQKVINIDLNSASPTIVIVGNLSDQPGPYTVTLNQTVNFSQPNTFPPVDGAFVTIADNAGTVDTLFETTTLGTYHTKKIQGVPGRTYTLNVTSNGQTYTSVSTMPQLVNFDTLIEYERIGPGFRGGIDTSYSPEVVLHDPAGIANYYRFLETVNDTLQTNFDCISDQYFDGKYIAYPIRHKINVGDSIKVEMQCINKGAYTYMTTIGQASGSTNVTPANPVSNISNNALGYFSAHTSRVRSIQIHR
ncbi:MAG TPA: DUF4249 domain-containing protein [Bacteroidia bacterium]|nr:DUF4249 domain-containing protein [Bacteroidia bacterium]